MDDHSEGLSEIDRALAAALDVDVSPDFAARVRQRIVDAPALAHRSPDAGRFWSGRRIAVPAAAAAALTVTTAVVLLSQHDARTPQPLASRPLVLGAIRPSVVRPGRPANVESASSNPPRIARTDVAPVARRAASEPEVLVPRAQIEMYRRLIAEAQKVPNALVVESPADGIAPAASEITIDPIKIEPIVPPIGGEGDRQ